MSDIQKHIKNMEALDDQFIEEMQEFSEKGGSQKIQQFKEDLNIAQKPIEEIDNVIMKLFEQSTLGKISDERFEKMSTTYKNEQKKLIETIRKYENGTELNCSMLVELID